jgi:hypothetical protein
MAHGTTFTASAAGALLSDLFDLAELADRVARRLVDVRRHPTLPLSVYNYSKGC